MTNEKKPHPDAPSWLFVRDGVRGKVYSINYRKAGKPNVRQVIEGEFLTWKQAAKAGEKIIAGLTYNLESKPTTLIRSEDLCNEIVQLKRAWAPATYEEAEIHFRVHIIPFLNEHCPYASELNPTVWLNYKTFKRLQRASISLASHKKFFGTLYKYAFEKGILPTPMKLAFNAKREDARKPGLIIPDDDLSKLLEAATPMWRDRIVIGRYTGMRPGEVRSLKKSDINFGTWLVSLRKEQTKTRTARSFVVVNPTVQAAFLRRLKNAEGPYLFPSGKDRSKHIDKSLKGWNAYRDKAGLTAHYTPHDLRHTYLTEMFKSGANPVLICFQAGLSLEEATKTYLHFTNEDTRSIAIMSVTPASVTGYR